MRMTFSVEEKIRLLSTIQVWKREQLTQEVFRKLQIKYGIPAYLIETLFWHMEILNMLLKEKNIAIEVQGVQYGTFEFEFNDTASGTLNYRHRMPSRFGEYERVSGKDVQAKSIRVQVNYKHSWLPAIKKVMKPVQFIITEVAPVNAVIFPHDTFGAWLRQDSDQ
jgi:hypothetical protein